MSVDTIKSTTPPRATKLLSLSVKRTIPAYAGGFEEFSLAHGLGYIPPYKVFFQSYDDHPERMFAARSNYDSNVPSLTINGYNKLTLAAYADISVIGFVATNHDTVQHDMKIFILLYAERATATQ